MARRPAPKALRGSQGERLRPSNSHSNLAERRTLDPGGDIVTCQRRLLWRLLEAPKAKAPAMAV